MNIVYAYGGATIFAQIVAEMRRPMDFLKAFSMAQALIFSVYVFYGLYVYSFQGQFTLPVAFQGVSHYSWQTVGNVLSLISGIIAGGLYGNIGLKILYVNVVEDFFNGPPLLSRNGRFAWTALVVVFWVVGFVIGAAIPYVSLDRYERYSLTSSQTSPNTVRNGRSCCQHAIHVFIPFRLHLLIPRTARCYCR